MKRLLPILLAACIASATAAPAFLVTEQEMVESNAAPPPFTARSVSAPVKDAPRIEVASPNLSGPLASPTPIQLNFEAAAPAAVKPETFRVLYGAFGIDITQRLLGAAKLNAQGISVQEASLPSGKHKLQLSVEDSLGRKGVRVLEFQIN